ncbi:MAG: hypothetical protein HOI65_09850 [Opitutae bacterium]|nr:hypothetical protein [Opitutae bacterium]
MNNRPARIHKQEYGVADWSIELPKSSRITAGSKDMAGNRELNPHKIQI